MKHIIGLTEPPTCVLQIDLTNDMNIHDIKIDKTDMES